MKLNKHFMIARALRLGNGFQLPMRCLAVLISLAAGTAHAQLSTRQISLPNQDYTESTEDLVVKVLGGRVAINRTWTWGKWYLNDRWGDLILYPDPMGGVLAVGRADRIYTRLANRSGSGSQGANSSGGGSTSIGSSGGGGGGSGISTGPKCVDGIQLSSIRAGDVFSFDENNYLRTTGDAGGTATGWQWYDREGNTIDYDAMGQLDSWTNAAGVKVSLVRDADGRITGVKDHQGKQVINVEYEGGAGYPTRVSDNYGRSVKYEWATTAGARTALRETALALPTSSNGSIGLAQLTKVTDSQGRTWTYTYNSAGYISTRTDPEGGQITLGYLTQPPRVLKRSNQGGGGGGGIGSGGGGGSGGISTGAQACGGSIGSTKISIPPAIRVGSFKDEVGATTNYRVDFDRVKQEYYIGIQLPNGAAQNLRYDIRGRRLQNQLAGMDLMVVSRDSETQDRITDARGMVTTVQYDSAAARRPTKIIYPDGSQETNTYESIYNRKTSHTDTLGMVSTWDYDAKGNVLQYVEAKGRPEQRTTQYTYDQWGQMLSKTRGAGAGQGADAITERFEYDANGNQTKVTNGQAQSSSFTFNPQGLPLTETDPLNQTTVNTYDPAGNLTSSTNPAGKRTEFSYDGRGRLNLITSAAGRSQSATYDKAGQLISVKDPAGAVTTLAYTPLGLPEQLKQPSGATFNAAYTLQGRISKLTDPAGNTTEYRYGASGDVLAGLQTVTVYPTFQETYGYNQRNVRTKVTQAIGRAENPTQLEGYDAMGQRVSATDPAGNTTLYQWDGLGRLIKVTDALGGITAQTWDAHDNLLTVTDAKGNQHKFAYDKAGRKTQETRPMGGTIQTAYDAAGRPTQRQDAGGNLTTYTWDAAENLTGKQSKLAGGTVDEAATFTYDSDGQLTGYDQKDGAGRLISSATYTLDALGRRTQTQLTYAKPDGSGTVSHTLGQDYNADGQLASQRWPDGSQGSFTYQNGQLNAIQLPGAGGQIGIGAYNWQVAGKITTPGVTITQTADPLQRFATIKVEQNGATPRALLTRGYQYDLAGNITRIDSDAGATDYGYDPLGRLTQAAPDQALQAKGLPQEQYGYDAVGNRTSSAHQAGAWSYNADNQLIQYPKTTPFSATPAVDTQVSYTPQGHTKEETNAQGTRTFSYNAAERLSELSQGSATVRYRYDPFGRRISKSVTQGGSTQTTYFLNGDSALMAEADGNGQISRAYGFSPNTQSEEQDLWSTDPVWQAELGGKSSLSDAAFHYMATDHLGTPILATDKQGNKSWRGQSEAFGNTSADGGSAIQMNLRFPGQYYDKETELHQNWFRDYNPGVGRYAQGDPIGLAGGLNIYAYTKNRPTMGVDPSGEFGPIGFVLGGAINGGLQLFVMSYVGGVSISDALQCIDYRKVITAAAFGFIGPTLGGNKLLPKVGNIFKKKWGQEYSIQSIGKNMGKGTFLNGMTSLSPTPPLHWWGANECECDQIHQNVKEKSNSWIRALSNLVM